MAMTTGTSGDQVPATERTLRWVGDLDHPFYDDERNRFVWYEASAIAFQMFLLANMVLVGAMLWVGGADGLPYAVPVGFVNGIVAIVALRYAEKRYADYEPQLSDLFRGRGVFVILLAAFMASGFLRAVLDLNSADATDGSNTDSFLNGFAEGGLFGLIAAPFLIAGFFIYRKRHPKPDVELADDEF